MATPKRGITVDLRNYICTDCKTVFIAETTLTHVEYSGRTEPLKDAIQFNMIRKLQERYIRNRQIAIEKGYDASLF